MTYQPPIITYPITALPKQHLINSQDYNATEKALKRKQKANLRKLWLSKLDDTIANFIYIWLDYIGDCFCHCCRCWVFHLSSLFKEATTAAIIRIEAFNF